MKKYFVFILLIFSQFCFGQISLISDCNLGSQGSYPESFTPFNNEIFFTAFESSIGRELWVSGNNMNSAESFIDLTAQNGNSTDTQSSFPRNLSCDGTLLIFAADDYVSGTEPYTTLGNKSTTSLLYDLNPGPASSNPDQFTKFKNQWVFAATGPSGRELYIFDPFANTVTLLKDIYVGVGSSNPKNIFNYNNTYLFFAAEDSANHIQVWVTDGTNTGTHLFKIINPSGNASPRGFAKFNNQLLFTADNGSGFEPYISDNTSSGTFLLNDINPLGSSGANEFTVINNTAYFRANDGIHGTELWKTDGTNSGTMMVKDIATGSFNAYPYDFTVVGNQLFFVANDSLHGNELWKTDGTNMGTSLVQDLSPGTSNSDPYALCEGNGYLVFRADNGSNGRELFIYNPNTNLINKDSFLNSNSYSPLGNCYQIIFLNGYFVFAANYANKGTEPYKLKIYPNGISTIDHYNSTFNLYPNPAKEVVNIKLETTKEVKKIVVLDVLGKEKEIVLKENNFENFSFSVSNFESQIYFIRIIYKDKSQQTKPFCVMH